MLQKHSFTYFLSRLALVEVEKAQWLIFFLVCINRHKDKWVSGIVTRDCDIFVATFYTHATMLDIPPLYQNIKCWFMAEK